MRPVRRDASVAALYMVMEGIIKAKPQTIINIMTGHEKIEKSMVPGYVYEKDVYDPPKQ